MTTITGEETEVAIRKAPRRNGLALLVAELKRLRRDVDLLNITTKIEELTIRVSRLETHEEFR